MRHHRQPRRRQHPVTRPVSERRRGGRARPARAYRERGSRRETSNPFYAQDVWHEPTNADVIQLLRDEPSDGFVHAVTLDEVCERVEQLPRRFRNNLDVIHLSRMTRKRSLFPCYGMQWGASVYLYPIEESLTETFVRPPRPEQLIEARMYGGVWSQEGTFWRLYWTPESLRDFYLNNVLIHEIGHINDTRNTSFEDRERYANWFAIEYGYRVSRGRR